MIVKIERVNKKFGNKKVFEDLNLIINSGETVGIVGSNGSGKSVLFKMISGLMDADSGDIFVHGNKVGTKYDFPKGIGLFVDSPGYIEYMNGFENLKLLAEIKHEIEDSTIEEYMKKIGLNPYDKTKVKNYSQGMKQKLGITQAIMENQNLILLDEPFNALDFQTNFDVINILRQIQDENKTMILTSHQHEYLERLCDKIYIILNHRLVEFTDEIKNSYFNI